ncbi:MAG: nicotinate (nicotinamide) nucleotide adenylyltransferase [Chloroflexi bacterium]|nr:nicotinate (nicotinamide) nucleotide adenylyltransferase [Chloroflexota bacterium]
MGLGQREGVPARRFGVFGGTFDPIHVGHVGVAEAARHAVPLDLIFFVPAARPRLRSTAPVASIDHRVAMVRLAVHDLAWARLSMVDAVRPGPAYSVDTLRDLRLELGEAADLYLIFGADSLTSLPEWKNPGELAGMARLVCVGRPGSVRPSELPPGHPGRGAMYVEGPMAEVSATVISKRIKSGKPTTGMLHRSVARYIEQNRLYR